MSLHDKLVDRERSGRPLRVGVIGGGTFGSQVIAQCCNMKGIRASSVRDIDVERAVEAYNLAGISNERVLRAESGYTFERLI